MTYSQLLAIIEANTEDYLLHKDDLKYETKAQENYSVLKHILVDPDAWIAHATATVGTQAVQDKIDKYRDDYLSQKNNIDYKTRAEREIPPEPTPEQVKQSLINNLLREQSVIQQAGFTCTNNIKLQVDELSLARWTQLMVGISAFSPETVVIRDYDNVNHTVTLAEATQMLQEVFAWGQWFFQDTWRLKDIIINS